MNAYILMKLTRKDLVEQVFDILTDNGFLWEDNKLPKRHLKEYLYRFNFERDEWVLCEGMWLCINLVNKRICYDTSASSYRDPWWLNRPYKLFRLDELETIRKLKNCLLILNEEEL